MQLSWIHACWRLGCSAGLGMGTRQDKGLYISDHSNRFGVDLSHKLFRAPGSLRSCLQATAGPKKLALAHGSTLEARLEASGLGTSCQRGLKLVESRDARAICTRS